MKKNRTLECSIPPFSSRRWTGLDMARTLAAIAVIFSHWKHFSLASYHNESKFALEPGYKYFRLLYDHGHMGVEFFFILSGFIFFGFYRDKIYYGNISAFKFLMFRFSRLYPLHFITLLLTCGLQEIYHLEHGSYFIYIHQNLFHFTLNFAMASFWGFQKGFSYNGPFWSVSVELIVYIIFFIHSKYIHYIKIVSFILPLGFFINNYPYPYPPESPILKCMVLFFLGGTLFHIFNAIKNKSFSAYLAYSVCVISWVFVFTNEYYFPMKNLALSYMHYGRFLISFFPIIFLFPSTILSLIFFDAHKPLRHNKFLFLGNISYSLYLLHFPLQLISVLGVQYVGYSNEVFSSTATLFIFLTSLIYFSHMTYKHFELPMQSYLRSRFMP